METKYSNIRALFDCAHPATVLLHGIDPLFLENCHAFPDFTTEKASPKFMHRILFLPGADPPAN
jgi:hypothetical protein